MRFLTPLFIIAALLCLAYPMRSFAAAPATTQPSSEPNGSDIAHQFDLETAALGGERSVHDGVLTIVIPRTDLWVQNEMGTIPSAAGIECRFYFYRCPCGKDRVVGQFAVADYELNDVIDVLRNGQMDIVSISPMFLDEKPRLMELRFQSEGNAEGLAGILQSAIRTFAPNRPPANNQVNH